MMTDDLPESDYFLAFYDEGGIHGLDMAGYTKQQVLDYASKATAPLLARIAELEKANEAFAARQEWWNSLMFELEQKVAELEADAKRLEFVESRLFGKSWNGVIDSGSRTDWRIASDYLHTTRKMVGHTFRDAIDNAMKDQP